MHLTVVLIKIGKLPIVRKHNIFLFGLMKKKEKEKKKDKQYRLKKAMAIGIGLCNRFHRVNHIPYLGTLFTIIAL